MAIKQSTSISFTQYYVDFKLSKTKDKFLFQINQAINWKQINKILSKHYKKGQSGLGRAAYSPLLLFKITLLQTWYNLSDYQVEEQVNDRLSFMKFCKVTLEDDIPDHSIISRFRKVLNKTNTWELLLEEINSHLSKHGILNVKQGVIVDASVTTSLNKPKGKTTYIATKEEKAPVEKEVKPGVDTEGSWLKKGGKLHYGYKRHYVSDGKHALVLSVHTTKASSHETNHLSACLDKVSLPSGTMVYADKGYCSSKNKELLKSKGLKNGIQQISYKSSKQSCFTNSRNKLISKVRYKIERVFGSIKRWFGRLETRYVGLAKTHGQHVLEAISYNLYRLPGIITSKA